MRTIIQHIGPLYGESNTGSVFGQPNGSIAITPMTDDSIDVWTIKYSKAAGIDCESIGIDLNKYTWGNATYYGWSLASYHVSDDSDPWSDYSKADYVIDGTLNRSIADTTAKAQLQVSTDTGFTTVLYSLTLPSGDFNISQLDRGGTYTKTPNYPDINNGVTYYIRFVLISQSGGIMGKSNTLTFKGIGVKPL